MKVQFVEQLFLVQCNSINRYGPRWKHYKVLRSWEWDKTLKHWKVFRAYVLVGGVKIHNDREVRL